MKNLKRILFFVVFFCLSLTSLSWAEFKITHGVSIREEYNDNIFLTPRDEEDDFITNVHPSITLSYNANLLTLSLDYSLDFRFYADHSNLNETSLINTQRAKLETTISPYKDAFFIRVFDEYRRVPIDIRRQVALDNLFVNLTDSNIFLVNPYLEYPLSATLKTKIGYSYSNYWYDSDEGIASETHSGTVSIIKEISSRINSSLSYTYLMNRLKKTIENIQDYDRQDISFNMNIQALERLTLNGGIGHIWFDHEKLADTDSTIWNIQAQYSLTDFISLGAGYSESFMDSVNIGTYKTKTATASISRQGNIPITLSGFKTINTYLSEDREDRLIGVTLNSSLPVTPKITIRWVGTYTDYEFLPEGEKVKRLGIGLSSDYALRITTITLGYTYNWNNSTIDAHDYKNNIIWAQARFTI